MKLLKTGLLFLLTASATAVAYEPEEIVACNGCSAYEKQSTALTAAYRIGAPQSRLNVIDLLNGSVITFRYQSVGQGSVGDVLAPGTESITIVPSDSLLTQDTRHVANFLSSTSAVYPSGREGIKTAADFIHHAQRERIINDFLIETRPLLWYFNNTISYAGGIARFDFLNGIPLRVEFEGGSFIFVKSYDWNSSVTFSMTYVDGSARDGDGNEIPTNLDEFLKEYKLTEQHVEDWISNAQRYGIQVTRSYTRTGRSEAELELDCIPVSRHEIHCVVRPKSNSSIEPE